MYTASITLGKAPYNYGSLNIGLVVLAFGIGNILASLLGGKYSDMVLRKLKKKNGGVGNPEVREAVYCSRKGKLKHLNR